MKTTNSVPVLYSGRNGRACVSPLSTRAAVLKKLPVQEAIGETVTDLEGLWAEDACETVVVKKKGHPLATVACSGNFDRAQRAKFLDVLFKHAF
jgi:hypothetical protein